MKPQLNSIKTVAPLLLGSLLLGSSSFPLIAQAEVMAQRPGIFNEPPYNRVPQSVTPAPVPDSSSELPTPNAIVSLANGRVSIQLVNSTGASISYQVIGDTQFRTLEGRSQTTLLNLEAPTTLTFRRQDGGLLEVTLQANPQPGNLVVNLDETTNFANDRTTMNIDRTGAVFLN